MRSLGSIIAPIREPRSNLCHPIVLERFYLAGDVIDIAAPRSRNPAVGRRAELGLGPFHRPVGPQRRAAIRSASAVVMASLASAAHADSIPPLSPGPSRDPFRPRPSRRRSRSLRPATARRPILPRRRIDAAQHGPGAGAVRFGLARPESAWRHVGPAARPGQVRRHAHHTRERRDVRESQRRRQAGLRSRRTDHRDATNGHGEGVRSQWRHAQRERPPILGRQSEHGQPLGPADPDRHRRAGRRSALGALVSAEIRRQVRHQNRRAEPR